MKRQMTDFGGLKNEFEFLFQQGDKIGLLSGHSVCNTISVLEVFIKRL